jgi:hypothetical protein
MAQEEELKPATKVFYNSLSGQELQEILKILVFCIDTNKRMFYTLV